MSTVRIRSARLVAVVLGGGALAALWVADNRTAALTGGCDQTIAPFLSRDANGDRRITYCGRGDANQLQIASEVLRIRSSLLFAYAGHPSHEGISVFLEKADGSRFDIRLNDAGNQWQAMSKPIPSAFRGTPVRLIVRDAASTQSSWVGVGEIRSEGPVSSRGLVFLLIAVAGVHLTLMTWLSVAQRRYPPDRALVAFLVGLGLAGYASFWAYYVHRWLGLTVSLTALAVSVYAVGAAWRHRAWSPLRSAHAILLPVSTYALFIIIVGYFPLDGVGSTHGTAASRWVRLSVDNWIVKIFADQVWAGRVATPMFGDWLSSDRPPLQVGLYLLFYAVDRTGVVYQAVSSVLQAMVMLPIILIVRRQAPEASPAALIALGMTSLMAVHTLFVWPKLLSATYVLLFFWLAMTLIPGGPARRHVILLMGSSAALAMLSHGSAIFALAGISTTYLLRTPRVAMATGLRAAFVSLVVYTPWLCYQRFIDPPGDRLLKWHLAGMMEPNTLSTTEALVTAYRAISIETWAAARLANLRTIFGGTDTFLRDVAMSVAGPVEALHAREVPVLVARSFEDTFYSLWCWSPVIAVAAWTVCRGYRKAVDAGSAWLAASAVVTSVLWSLLQFMPGATIIHQGSYFTWVAFFLVSILLLWHASRRVFALAMTLNGAIFFHFYVLDVLWKAPNDSGLPYIVVAALAFAAFVKAALASGRATPLPGDGRPLMGRAPA